MNSSSDPELDNKVRRLEKAVRELIDGGHWFPITKRGWRPPHCERASICKKFFQPGIE
jgi:hypothetical protein